MSAARRVVVIGAATAGVAGGLALAWWALGPRNVATAFLVNWLPLSWAPTVRSAYRLSLPEAYHRLRRWEADGRVYERLGVARFQRLIRTPLMAIWNQDIPRAFRDRDYVRAEREMRFAEASHAVVFVGALLVAVSAAARGWWDAAATLAVLDVLLNGYPVMLQRYNRGRLARMAGRARGRQAGSASRRWGRESRGG